MPEPRLPPPSATRYGRACSASAGRALRPQVRSVAMEPMVVAHNVHKRYGDVEVLKGIDLEVEAGKVVCIIGASGAGKSTFLRCINHLERPDEGYVLVDGQLVGLEKIGRRLHETSER